MGHNGNHKTRRPSIVSLATAFVEQTPDDSEDVVLPDIEIPEDLGALTDEELSSLIERSTEAALAIYDPVTGDVPSQNEIEVLRQIAEGVELLQAEQANRDTAAQGRAEEAAALASRILPVDVEADPEDESGAENSDEENPDAEAGGGSESDADNPEDEGNEPESLAASAAPARRPVTVNLSSVRARQNTHRPAANANTAPSVRDLVTIDSNAAVFAGESADLNQVGQAMLRRHQSMPMSQFELARAQGKHLRQQFGLMTIRKPFDDGLTISNNDPEHVEEVLRHAMDPSRLPGGSLVASGGWCPPAEVIYDLCELESRDGLFSLPEVNWARGSISRTLGPDFASIFEAVGFSFTNEQDISGEDYPKPCVEVPCPDFDDFVLNFDGLCITAGLLQRRAYPEAIARFIRGALVAHDHKMAAHLINGVVDGSTAVALPAAQVGATAPILTAIELQAEHVRYTNRLSRSAPLEGVFPFWVHGAIRADLMRRTGVSDLDSVPDSRIDAWFANLGVSPQFIYNWQDINTTPASGFTSWPTTIDFALYPTGTWIKGANDIITLDTIYDSVLLGTNDYTALFSEEGWQVVKMCHDSRVVTVPICADGSTAIAVAIDCDGSAG